jgi:diadenosine tetraphosphate (Ap4A) HIT family hydrolase
VWSTPSEWERRRRAEGCVICSSGRPLDVIAELPSAWVIAQRAAPLAGCGCVVAKQHVVEPFEMSADDQCRFWLEAMLVASAVANVVHPIKMNYEIHGNTLPHLHLHLFPRQVDDPYVGGPIDPHTAVFDRSDEEIEVLASAIRAAAAQRRVTTSSLSCGIRTCGSPEVRSDDDRSRRQECRLPPRQLRSVAGRARRRSISWPMIWQSVAGWS